MLSFGENSRPRLLGAGHLILNALRTLNIIGLLAVAVSSWILIVMSSLTGNFFFFEVASHFFNSTIAAFLICSELNLFKSYYASSWPVLAPRHGLAWLGTAMVVMGCHVLGNLNRRGVSSDNLGGHLYRVVLASGILAVTFGVFNIVSSFVFRDSASGITARHVRDDGAIASSTEADPSVAAGFNHSYNNNKGYYHNRSKTAGSFSDDGSSFHNEKALKRLTQKFPWNKGGNKGGTGGGGGGGSNVPVISRPFDFRPQDDDDVEKNAGMDKSGFDINAGANGNGNNPYPDSEGGGVAEDRRSPIMPDVPRPPTALHPAYNRHSRYSEVSNMNRF